MHDRSEDGPLRDLTKSLASGDNSAWSHFHAEYGPWIFHQLLAASRGDHSLASEALQQTYLRVARYVRPCDSDLAFKAWLRRLANSALLDCWRRRAGFWRMLKKRGELPLCFDFSDEREALLLSELEASLATLNEADRLLLHAKYYDGYDVRTLAERMMTTPKAMESRLARARAELRRIVLVALSRHEKNT